MQKIYPGFKFRKCFHTQVNPFHLRVRISKEWLSGFQGLVLQELGELLGILFFLPSMFIL